MEMRDPPEGATLLRVIKPLVWKDDQRLAEESGCSLKVGDKTWTSNWEHSCTHLEGNRWSINFDKSCFEVITEEKFKELSDEEPVEIKQELPETGLLVANSGVIVYRIEGSEGFGFNPENYGMSNRWSFISEPYNWRTATPEDKARFIEMLEAEAERLGLGADVKIKGHAGGMETSFNNNVFTPVFTLTEVWNKNGQIFHNGVWAQPLDETQPAPIQPETQKTSEEEVKPQYRIKTIEEFERDDNMLRGYPKGWSEGGEMDVYYGQILPKFYYLEGITTFTWDGWSFSVEHDIVKVSEHPLSPTEALGKTSTLGDISYQRDIEIEKVKKENVKRDFTPMKNIV